MKLTSYQHINYKEQFVYFNKKSKRIGNKGEKDLHLEELFIMKTKLNNI